MEVKKVIKTASKRHASIQSQHSSFEDATTVHPLRNLLLRIRNELDPEVVHQLICLSRKQLQDQFESVVKEYDLLDFFNTLEIRYGTENAAKYIETLLEYDHLHGDCGQCRLADMIQHYRVEKAEYMVKCQEKGVPLDPYFVGRDQIMSEILQHLKKPAPESKGVLIYGQSGVGKSSLAREVCYRLRNDSKQWQITLVNLRERTILKELMDSLLLKLADDRWSSDLDVAILKSELVHAIRGQARSRNIIWLDNIDELCDTQEKWSNLIEFLGEVGSIMDKEKDCQMKILVTVAENSGEDYLDDVYIHTLEGTWKVVHMSNLSQDDSELLLQKLSSTSLETVQAKSLYIATCGNPVAIRMIGTLLHSGKPVNNMEVAAHTGTPPGSPSFQVERCIEQAFQALDKNSQSLLVKLSVFRTEQFDLETAVLVTSTDRKILEQAKVLNEKKYELLVNLNHLRICNFIEEEEEKIELTKMKIFTEKKTNHKFSLHPLICHYLQKNQGSSDFIEDLAQAKHGFCTHFCSLINKYLRKYDSSETEAAKTIWKDNWIHVKTWFHYVTSECLPVDKFCENNSHCKPLQTQARLWRVAQTVLGPSEQLRFLQQQTKLANQSKKWFSAVVWIALQVEYHVNQKKVEVAEQLMNGVPEEFNSFVPRTKPDTWNADQNLAQADELFKNVAEEYSQEEQLGILVASAFYYSTYGYILEQGSNIKTSRNYFRLAHKLFSGKYGKPDIQKQIKQSYKFELSKNDQWLTMLKRQFHESQNPHHYRHSTASSNSSADLDSIYSSSRESCSSTEIQECCLLLNESSSSRRQAWISASSNRNRSSRDSQALSSCSDTSWRDSYESTDSFGRDSLEVIPGLSSEARRRKSVTSLMGKLQTNAEDFEMQTDASDDIHVIKRKKTDE